MCTFKLCNTFFGVTENKPTHLQCTTCVPPSLCYDTMIDTVVKFKTVRIRLKFRWMMV